MDNQSPCFCQRCAWLGVFSDTVDAACPKCSRGPVQKLLQKGIDGLREERRLLQKLSYARHLTHQQRVERIEQISDFLQRLQITAAAHVHCPRCCWASWGREARGGICPVCAASLCVAEYDYAAISQYVELHQDDLSPRDGLSGQS